MSAPKPLDLEAPGVVGDGAAAELSDHHEWRKAARFLARPHLGKSANKLSARRRIRRQTTAKLWHETGEKVQRLSLAWSPQAGVGTAGDISVDVHSEIDAEMNKTAVEDGKTRGGNMSSEGRDGEWVRTGEAAEASQECCSERFGPACSPKYLLSCVLSAVVVFVLMQAFCIVFALIIMDEEPFSQYVPLVLERASFLRVGLSLCALQSLCFFLPLTVWLWHATAFCPSPLACLSLCRWLPGTWAWGWTFRRRRPLSA